MSSIGKTAEVRLRAFPPDAAEDRHFSPEYGFPAALVQLMELAAAHLMRPMLEDGFTSVSVEMNTRYYVTSPSGEMRAVATFLGARGRLHHYRVDAFDESGLIASAEHTRAVVVPRRLMAGARRRAGKPAMLINV